MKITYDPQADALYFELRPREVAITKEVASGVYLDFDTEGEVRGVELLYVSHRAPEVARGHIDLHLPIPTEMLH